MTTELTTNTHPMRWVPTLYLAEGLPFYAVALVAGLMYKSLGVPNGFLSRSGVHFLKRPAAKNVLSWRFN